MTDSSSKLLSFLANGCTVNSLKEKMNLTDSQLAYRLSLLKNMGYFIQPKYYANGDILLYLSDEANYLYDNNAKIYTKSTEDNIRILAISDLHYFHEDEDRKAVDNAFNYCAKNNIHIIFICGDLIDCMENNWVPIDKQAETFAKLYPHDDSIISFGVLGNHDFMSIKKNNLDFKKIIERKRLDIVPVDYLGAGICIKNDILFLEHPINDLHSNFEKGKGNRLFFIGHSHTTKISEKQIYVPSLSNVKVGNRKNFCFIPQALDVTLYFNAKIKTFNNAVVDQLVMNENPYIVSEHSLILNTPPTNNRSKLEVNEYPSLKRTL